MNEPVTTTVRLEKSHRFGWQVLHDHPCGECEGRGWCGLKVISWTCDTCHGEGIRTSLDCLDEDCPCLAMRDEKDDLLPQFIPAEKEAANV